MLMRNRFLALLSVLVPVVLALGKETPQPIQSPPVPTNETIEKLIAKLGDADTAAWRKVGKQLEAIGEPALGALQKVARSNKDADYRLRAAVVARAIVDSQYGGEIRLFAPPHSLIQSVAFLGDGRILSGSDDGCLRLWDAEKGKEIRCCRGHAGRVLGVSRSPDGKQALTAGEDKTVRLWDLASGKELRQFTGHGDWVTCVEFSPDGKQAVSCSGGHWDQHWKTGIDTTSRLWDVETGKEIQRFKGHTEVIFHAAFLPDGKQVVTSSADKTVRLWDIKTGEEVRKLTGHTSEVRFTAPLPDGQYLLSGSMDGTLRVWDVSTGKTLRTIHSNTTFHHAALVPGGKRIVTLSWYGPNRSLRLWDIGKGKELHRFFLGEAYPTCVAISADGRRMAAGDYHGQLRLWRLGK